MTFLGGSLLRTIQDPAGPLTWNKTRGQMFTGFFRLGLKAGVVGPGPEPLTSSSVSEPLPFTSLKTPFEDLLSDKGLSIGERGPV